MRYSPHILDEIRARLPVSQVVGRRVALKKAGREFKGLSPFKTEKTPSFTVNDQKGFYHCFATGEHGDIFTFLMKVEGLEFPEAVERLAAEAGVMLPKPTERDDRTEDQRQRLYALLAASAAFFVRELAGQAGREARRYVEGRGLSPETAALFGLGYAPAGRHSLRQHLTETGFSVAEMVTSGMLIGGDDIPEPYDRFRNRLMFPILDLKGRAIAFGGRALDKDAPAKYLNSPETPLFHKGHVLFNAARARPAAHDHGRLIVVEGYMDVVALADADIVEAVAPLGTALTGDQVRLLWRATPEPTLCFDGDGAGLKAAHRAVDTVLPLLTPGHSVRFVFLPDGLDPDDMIRQQGAAALRAELDRTTPLIDVLWSRELAAGPLETPEQRAALEARVRGLVQTIADPVVRAHYDREVRDRLYRVGRTHAGAATRGGATGSGRAVSGGYTSPAFMPDWKDRDRMRLAGPSRGRRGGSGMTGGGRGFGGFGSAGGRPGLAAAASPALSRSQTASPNAINPREALMLKTIINHPWLIDHYAEAIAMVEFNAQPLSSLRDHVLMLHATSKSLDTATLATQLSKSGLQTTVDLIARALTHASDRFAEAEASTAEVETAWRHLLAIHQRQSTLERALKAAEDAWYRDCTVEAETRLFDIKRQIAALDQENGDNAGFPDMATVSGSGSTDF